MAEDATSMTIWDHLDELRSRLLKATIALAIGAVISFSFAERAIDFLASPIGGIEKLQSIDVTENISVYMRVSLLGGVLIAMPFILYQLLRFIIPGLTSQETRWVLVSIPLATILFAGGVVFTFYVMLPTALPFLMNIAGIPTIPRPSTYFGFITNLMFWIGIAFEAPLLMYVLARLGIVNAKMLAQQWRIAIVVIAVASAMITPTVDPVNMSILMVPLFTLYLLSIFLAFLAQREKK